MRTRLIVFSILWLSACSCVNPAPTACVKVDPSRKLYIYGDSIVAGFDHPNNYGEMVGCQTGLAVVNLGIGGTAITFDNQYSLIMAAEWEPGSTILFSPGVNDAILNGIRPEYVVVYRQYLTDIISKIKTSGVTAYIGTPNMSCDEPRFGPNSEKTFYGDINRKLVLDANSDKIHLVDFNSEFYPSKLNTHDCLHPNNIGNRQMAQILMNYL